MNTPATLPEQVLKAFQNVPDLYLILSPELVILTASDAYLKATFTKRELIVGKYVFESFPDNPAAREAQAVTNLKASLQQVLLTKIPHRMPLQHYDVLQSKETAKSFDSRNQRQRASIESTGVTSEFVQKYWLPLNTPVLDENGQVHYIIHKVEDVTELISQGQLIADLRVQTMQQQRANQILNALNAAFIELDKQYRYLYLNTKAEELLGKDSDQLLGKVMWEVFPQAVGTAGYHAIIKACKEQVKVETEYFSAIFNKWTFLSAEPSPEGVILFIYDRQDIKETQQQLSEEHRRLKQAQAIGYVGSFEWNITKDTVYWSDEMYRIHGLVPQSEVITLEKVLSFIHPEDKAWVSEKIRQSQQKAGRISFIHRLLAPDGQVRFIRRQVESFADLQGKVTYLSGTVQDITEQQQAQQQLEQQAQELAAANEKIGATNEQLESSHRALKVINQELVTSQQALREFNEELEGRVATRTAELLASNRQLEDTLKALHEKNFELDQFVYKTSHDLRAPLSTILGLVSILKQETNEATKAYYVDLIEQRVHKLDKFIRSMLDYSRNTRTATTLQQVNFKELIHECLQELEQVKHFDRLRIWLQIEEGELYSDVFRMKIIFANLISNAIKYQDFAKQESYLRIEVGFTEKQVVIGLSDNGVGIERQHQDNLFNMFFRASEQSEGSGLGLYIVKQAVNILHGSIGLESEPRVGTRFVIHLPVAPRD